MRCLFTGVFTAAHDLKMEWVIIKGISDYADGTASSTEHWKPFASVMAASVVNNILREPVIFKQWPHYQKDDVRGGTVGCGLKYLQIICTPVSTFENIRHSLTLHVQERITCPSLHVVCPAQSNNPMTFNSGLRFFS